MVNICSCRKDFVPLQRERYNFRRQRYNFLLTYANFTVTIVLPK